MTLHVPKSDAVAAGALVGMKVAEGPWFENRGVRGETRRADPQVQIHRVVGQTWAAVGKNTYN